MQFQVSVNMLTLVLLGVLGLQFLNADGSTLVESEQPPPTHGLDGNDLVRPRYDCGTYENLYNGALYFCSTLKNLLKLKLFFKRKEKVRIIYIPIAALYVFV